MRALVGIMSCQRDRPHHKLVRETWLQNEVDHRFFLGGVSAGALLEDEVLLDTPDGYYSYLKLQSMATWALSHEYDFMFKCDTDTYVCVPRLLASGFEEWDWSGTHYGGSGYWLKKPAMEVLNKAIPDGKNWVEDQWAVKQLSEAGSVIHSDPRYRSQDDINIGPAPSNNFITTHCYRTPRHFCLAYERLAMFPAYYKAAKDIT